MAEERIQKIMSEQGAGYAFGILIAAFGVGCVIGGFLQDSRGPRCAALWGTALLCGGFFAAAVAIRLWNKKEGIGALVLAALISFSRLYLTVHYPTDVLASVVFGSAYGGAAYLLMKKVLEKPGRLRKVLVEGASYKTLWKK